jgi:hypothetical protein
LVAKILEGKILDRDRVALPRFDDCHRDMGVRLRRLRWVLQVTGKVDLNQLVAVGAGTLSGDKRKQYKGHHSDRGRGDSHRVSPSSKLPPSHGWRY